MKNLVILIILIGLGYFAYNAFNNSETLTQSGTQTNQQEGLEDIADELPQGQQGALININNQIQGALGDARQAVEQTQDRVNSAIEEGITNLADTNVEIDMETATEALAGPGNYLAYEDVNIASLEGDIVLDFYASWCPSCRRLEADINDSLNDIPSDLNIVVVNYDNETDLKAKYGVTRQHTLVQVDQQGNLIKKWSGGNTLESIVGEVI